MTRQSLPRGGADSGPDPLTLQSEMRIAALVAARRAAAVAAGNRPPQAMVSRNPIADVLALYSADPSAQAGWASVPPRPPSPLFAITANLVASVRQAAEQRRRIPGAAAQARAADTVAARISPAEARLLQLLGGSGRVDRRGIRHFDNPALVPDADATPPNGPGTPDSPAPASSAAAAASPPVPAPSPPPPALSFSADDGWQHGNGWVPMAYREDASGPHWKLALPGALRNMLAGVEDIAQQRVTPEGTLTPNALGVLTALPFAGAVPEGSLAMGAARRPLSPGWAQWLTQTGGKLVQQGFLQGGDAAARQWAQTLIEKYGTNPSKDVLDGLDQAFMTGAASGEASVAGSPFPRSDPSIIGNAPIAPPQSAGYRPSPTFDADGNLVSAEGEPIRFPSAQAANNWIKSPAALPAGPQPLEPVPHPSGVGVAIRRIMVQPSADSLLYATDLPPSLFRGDTRPRRPIFDEGFDPRGTSTDLLAHAWDNLFPPSGYVSTSKSPQEASAFGKLYVIRPRVGVDVNATLGKLTPIPDEQEIAIPGRVDPGDIRAVTLPGKGISVLNPRYKP